MPPLIIAGAIAAGGALAGAKMTSNAANKAAKGQQDAARQVQRFNEQVYSEQKQRMAPYEAMGNSAMQRYGSYVQQPFNERLASLGQPYSPRTAAGGPFALGAQQQPAAPVAPAPMQGGGGGFGFGPPGGRFDTTGVDIGTQPAPTMDQFGDALAATQGGTVNIQNPADGSVRAVPANLVDKYIAKGGRVVA